MTKGNALPDAANWTQEEAISYECASEAITHAMAIVTDEIAAQHPSSADAVSRLRAQRTAMANERAALHTLPPNSIADVSARYCAFVRTKEGQPQA